MRSRCWSPIWQTNSSPKLVFCAGVWNWAGFTSSLNCQCSPPFCVCRMKVTWMMCITCLHTCPCITIQGWCLTLPTLTLICVLSSRQIGSPCMGTSRRRSHQTLESKEKAIELRLFMDSDHAGEQSARRSTTGFVIYLNMAPIVWFSKRQPTIESSVFGDEFV
jgi:hypothetical protein